MSKRKEKRYDQEYRVIPALIPYDPRFFPGGTPGYPVFPAFIHQPGRDPFPPGQQPGHHPAPHPPVPQHPVPHPPVPHHPVPHPPVPHHPVPHPPVPHHPVPHPPAGGFPGAPGAPGAGIAHAPTTPPPSYIPKKPYHAPGTPQPLAVSPTSLRPCLRRYVYIWLHNGASFWFYPIYLDRRTVAGFRWNGFSWSYMGIDLRQIATFQCV
ncbi:transporter [Tumebacillus algifaecis]|uniref:transporter n=1 Tax=Tumebacillus algifaecis TaxID=1214604 RepID=UPI0012FD174B|nr:transporter [Tumebacillus algifaecis]